MTERRVLAIIFGTAIVVVFGILAVAVERGENQRNTTAVTVTQRDDVFTTRWRQDAWIESTQDNVRYRLTDPNSAVFRDVYFNHAVVQGEDAPMVCGSVGARNAVGVMLWQRFIGTGGEVGRNLTMLEEDFAEGEFEQSWATLCR